jgi:hypothetical protein
MDILPLPQPHSLTVFCATGRSIEPVTQVMAELAVRGPLTVLDGGNRFPAYHLIRLIRSRVPDPSTALQHTFLRRAFTCAGSARRHTRAAPAVHPFGSSGDVL